MQDFVMEGGGLLIGGHAWYWCYCYPELNLPTDFAGTTTISSVFTGMSSLVKDVYKRKGVSLVLSIGKPVGTCERLQ